MWKCQGADSGTVFDEVELEEGEWVDYDEKVAIYAVQYAIVTDFRTGRFASWSIEY